jgi:deoxyribose-phosphate aldolase
MSADPVVRMRPKADAATPLASEAPGASGVQGAAHRPRNDGTPLRTEWFEGARVNSSAVERRAATLSTRRSVKKEWQAAWLVKAITCMDLTTLAGDDTAARVQRLCAKARNPLRRDLLEALGLDAAPQVGAVCVYPTMVRHAVEALAGSGIPVASVATGFPPVSCRCRCGGGNPLGGGGGGCRDRHRHHARPCAGHDWEALYDEIRAMREACGEAHLKAYPRHRRPEDAP